MRRRASANVHQISAAQMTIRTRIRTLTAVFSASLLMPKTATVSMGSRERVLARLQEQPTEGIAEREEDEHHQRDADRDDQHQLQQAGPAFVHRADLLRAPGSPSRSATREIEPVATTAPSEPASARARSTARCGSGSISPAPPSWPASDSSVAGESARGFAERVSTAPDAFGSSSRSIATASLSSRTETTTTGRRPSRT